MKKNYVYVVKTYDGRMQCFSSLRKAKEAERQIIYIENRGCILIKYLIK